MEQSLRYNVVLLALIIILMLTGCGTGIDDPISDFRRDIEGSDSGRVNALVLKFDGWLLGSEFLGIQVAIQRVFWGLFGLSLLVAGFKIYEFMVMLSGIVIGGGIGYGLGSDTNIILALFGLVMGAIIGGSLVLALHNLAIFLVGAIYGALLVGAAFNFDLLAMIIGGILAGVLVLSLLHLAIVVLTAGVGAILFGGLWIGASANVITILWLVGIFVQFGLIGSATDESEKKSAAPAGSG